MMHHCEQVIKLMMLFIMSYNKTFQWNELQHVISSKLQDYKWIIEGQLMSNNNDRKPKLFLHYPLLTIDKLRCFLTPWQQSLPLFGMKIHLASKPRFYAYFLCQQNVVFLYCFLEYSGCTFGNKISQWKKLLQDSFDRRTEMQSRIPHCSSFKEFN